jgi:hypothetical protein
MRVRKLVTTLAAALAAMVLAGPAAAQTFTLEGGATNEGTHIKLVSDATHPSSAILFSMPEGTKFSDIETLRAEFNVTDDDCGGGSPRFQLTLDDGKNVFVYFGPSPSFTGCTANTWLATGNLVGNNDACRWDTSQVAAGTQCTTYDAARALVGSRVVTEVRLVVDAGWRFADGEQTVLVRNVVVDGVTAGPSGMNPAQTCRTLRASMGEEAFRNTYGTNRNKRNAFGMCVSQTARMKATERHEVANAAASCKAERAADQTAFTQRFGNGRNAFGKCVASKAGTNPVATAAAANRGKGKGRRP